VTPPTPEEERVSTAQSPIGSQFGPASTAGEVIAGIDLTGKTAVVTGGASGIGIPTVQALRSAGATVVVPARNVEGAREILAGLDVEVQPMDLMVPKTIDVFAARFLTSGRPLHLLVNNGGIGGAPLTRDERGYESVFTTNHLGHFHLTCRLWSALRAANGARVVDVSSWAHRASPVVLEDLMFERRVYDPVLSYGQSKTANILHAVAVDKRGEADGIRAFSLHPGTIVDSNFKRYTPSEVLTAFGLVDENGDAVIDPAKSRKTVEQGAATTVWCATSPQLDDLGGLYAQDCDIAPLVVPSEALNIEFGSPPLGVMSYAVDADVAEQLWIASERLTQVRLAA
jgi:NAD(P)-dependent dehydrogenase (short-subunit alcohol dehydrogenase family)